MGLLDTFLFDYFDPFARTDKRAVRLMSEGELVDGKLYAIKYREHSEDADDMWMGFDFMTAAGPLRASVKQFLPWDEHVRLGNTFKLRHLDGDIGVDWTATKPPTEDEPDKSGLPGKTLKKTLEPGIDDNRLNLKKIAKRTPTTGTITDVEATVVFGVATQNLSIAMTLDDGSTVVAKNSIVPIYCVHLTKVGEKLPVAIDPNKPDKPIIDWKRAAEESALS